MRKREKAKQQKKQKRIESHIIRLLLPFIEWQPFQFSDKYKIKKNKLSLSLELLKKGLLCFMATLLS